ncbi:MAG: ABC transporter substrate-binding protein [Methanomicrobiaceae archaeon]|nr:ABC transporter substrate-binding protein [Methanomicrobiaceae archaeon]
MNGRGACTIILSLLLIGTVAAYPYAPGDSEITRSFDYLHTCQNTDGGFGEAGRASNPGTSTWVLMALAAAGEDPREWRAGGSSSIDYLRDIAEETVAIDGTAETAKMVLTIIAIGEDPGMFEGTDFVELLKAKQQSGGRFGDHIYTTNWGMLALAAAGEDTASSVAWLKNQQNGDGGFGWTPGAESDSDDTASAVMALIAAGEPRTSPAIQKALSFFRSVQMDDGGFNYGGSSGSNSASTAWVIQALVAAGENPITWQKNGIDVISHLISYRQPEGYFRWTPVLADNPCRMTASVVTALLGMPYPIMPDQTAPVQSGNTIPTTTIVPVTTHTAPSPAVSGGDDPVITVTDDFGETVTITGTPQRIVSLAPANTEILFALGLGDRVVGVTDYCNHPSETVAIEKVGGYSTVNVEKVVAARPDLVIAAFGNTEEVVSHLRSLGLTIIALNPESIDDIIDNIRLVGTATGTGEKAEAIAADMERRIAAVVIARDTRVADRPSVVHLVWYDPIWVSGSGTFQDQMFEMAGGTNAFPGVNGWEIVSLEEFVTTNPDIILVNSGTGMGESGYDLIYTYVVNEPRFQGLAAVRNGRVYVVDSDMIDRGGPRIVDALEQVATDIHPEIFEAPESTPIPVQYTSGFGGIAALMVIGLVPAVRAGKR